MFSTEDLAHLYFVFTVKCHLDGERHEGFDDATRHSSISDAESVTFKTMGTYEDAYS